MAEDFRIVGSVSIDGIATNRKLRIIVLVVATWISLPLSHQASSAATFQLVQPHDYRLTWNFCNGPDPDENGSFTGPGFAAGTRTGGGELAYTAIATSIESHRVLFLGHQYIEVFDESGCAVVSALIGTSFNHAQGARFAIQPDAGEQIGDEVPLFGHLQIALDSTGGSEHTVRGKFINLTLGESITVSANQQSVGLPLTARVGDTIELRIQTTLSHGTVNNPTPAISWNAGLLELSFSDTPSSEPEPPPQVAVPAMPSYVLAVLAIGLLGAARHALRGVRL